MRSERRSFWETGRQLARGRSHQQVASWKIGVILKHIRFYSYITRYIGGLTGVLARSGAVFFPITTVGNSILTGQPYNRRMNHKRGLPHVTIAMRRPEGRDHSPVGCLLRMGAATEVVDDSTSLVARPGALRDAASSRRHDGRVLRCKV